MTNDNNTLVVNLFAGPGAGKTTCAWLIAGELKKRNIATEYVPEHAKELVWDEKHHLLDGTYANQLMILKEQNRRLKRLVGKVDIIVTDSPLLLSCMYVKEQHERMQSAAMEMYDRYNNFNLFISRGHYFEQSGRIHDLQESVVLDNGIKAFLENNSIYYGTYRHDTLNVVVKNIQTTLRKLQEYEIALDGLMAADSDLDEGEDVEFGAMTMM